MNKKAFSGYLAVLTLSFLLYAFKPSRGVYYGALPALMLIFPMMVGYRVRMNLSAKHLLFGLIVSLLILFPYYLIADGDLREITLYSFIFQLLSVSFPEEFFFRGFLQDSLGRSLKAIATASLLFSLAHLPRAIFSGDWTALLSFFPSLIMGWLYTKTGNILPGTIFHLFANLVYQNSR